MIGIGAAALLLALSGLVAVGPCGDVLGAFALLTIWICVPVGTGLVIAAGARWIWLKLRNPSVRVSH